jgi:transposase
MMQPLKPRLRIGSESRSTQATARALNLKLLYKWPQDAPPALLADSSEAAEVRQLRAANKRLAQEPEILKKPSPSSAPHRPRELLSFY